MTEDEAKTKWCPMVRHAEGAAGEYHEREEFVATNRRATCCGSRCMMWRWKRHMEYEGGTPHQMVWPKPNPIEIISDTEGYCGLASKNGAI